MPPEVLSEMQAVVRAGVPGVTMIAMKAGKQLFRLDIGNIDSGTEYPVASASKWVTTALVMTVVDEGKLSLDVPISSYLHEFQGDSGKVTLRQLLAQTSGEGDIRSRVDISQDARMTLRASAAEVAGRPLQDPPGQVFRYGGPGFQVAGALVETVTGQRWADLFNERIAGPLAMSHTRWEHLPARGVTATETLNPLLQGGLITTADDYSRFLTMLAQRGEFGGRRIISKRAVDLMENVQTLGKPMAYVPPGVTGDLQYALGNWCATWTADGQCTLAMSPGAFGTFPWIDWRSGVYGIIFMRGRLPRVSDHLRKAMQAAIASGAGMPRA